MKRKIILTAALLFGLFIIISASRSIYTLYKSGSRIDKEKQEVEQLAQENAKLRKQIEQAQTPEYIEQVARDQLNLAKPGEVVMVLSRKEATISTQTIEVIDGTNWQRWWKIFFDR